MIVFALALGVYSAGVICLLCTLMPDVLRAAGRKQSLLVEAGMIEVVSLSFAWPLMVLLWFVFWLASWIATLAMRFAGRR